jgi:hypothetical protein
MNGVSRIVIKYFRRCYSVASPPLADHLLAILFYD